MIKQYKKMLYAIKHDNKKLAFFNINYFLEGVITNERTSIY